VLAQGRLSLLLALEVAPKGRATADRPGAARVDPADERRKIRFGIYGSVVTRRLRTMGIRDKPTAPTSPRQNGVTERLIGSIRRKCVDDIIVLGEVHLRQILQSYARYYNDIRTHRSLEKDAPVTRQIQRIGSIKSHVILGGLHHHYARA
jgi:hypothetical protein